jgi:hypothetical protein
VIRPIASSKIACLALSGIQPPIAALARSPLERLGIFGPFVSWSAAQAAELIEQSRDLLGSSRIGTSMHIQLRFTDGIHIAHSLALLGSREGDHPLITREADCWPIAA